MIRDLILDIWKSLRSMPLWVQVWMFGVLVPANIAAILFVGEPGGVLIAVLAISGLLPNGFFLIYDRGFSAKMAVSHLIFWIPLCVILWPMIQGGEDIAPTYRWFLRSLFAINVFSLVFDVRDAWQLLRRNRALRRP